MNIEMVSEYIEELYEGNKLKRKQFIKDTELKDFGLVVDDDVARMLQVIITMIRPKRILEIGTSIGFSTVMMAKAMKHYGGKIVTIELNAEVAEQAVRNFQREGVKEQIHVKVGDVRAVISGMNGKYDLIFQDVGDKRLYAEMLEDYVKLLSTGGVLLAEDTLFPVFDFDSEYKELAQMRNPLDMFNKKVANCSQFKSTLLPIGDGLTIAVKRDN